MDIFRLRARYRGWPREPAGARADSMFIKSQPGEMTGSTADPGQDLRGAPDPGPMWAVLDCTPEGRGADWCPSLEYGG
jgi:predicted dithiol-disulfide oxidoreductase (DUF899 family)